MKFVHNTINGLKRAVGLDQLKSLNRYLIFFGKSLWSETEAHEHNQVPLNSLGYSPEYIAQLKLTFKRIMSLYLLLALVALVITVHTVFTSHNTLPKLLGLAALMVCLAQAFRYHFWLFQLRKGKLGCTLREWFNGFFDKR
jgi:hypothetical protein